MPAVQRRMSVEKKSNEVMVDITNLYYKHQYNNDPRNMAKKMYEKIGSKFLKKISNEKKQIFNEAMKKGERFSYEQLR